MEHTGTVIIKTERLILRQITDDDASAVFEWMCDFEVAKYERWKPHESSEYTKGYIREVFKYYDNPKVYEWGIEYEGRLIGTVSIVNIDDWDSKGTLGYCLAQKHWSKGYMSEAVEAVLKHMFLEVKINRVEASHSVNNIGSKRVLEKTGFILEGVAKDYFLSNVGMQDSRLLALVRQDYLKKPK